MIKFATHVLAFGQDKWIMKNIENSYNHVDKIYIAYSEVPWNYNSKARVDFNSKMDLDIIKNSKFYDKIEIIEGIWDTEEDQRNSCVDMAIKDGIDYLFIHDADEFYHHGDFEKMKLTIKQNPSYKIYRCPWYNFWKDMKITIKENGDKIAGYPDICINLKKGTRFFNKRTAYNNKIEKASNICFNINDVICYHLSYVLSDEEILKKLKTWGHTNDFNTDKWYNEIWLSWHSEMTNLHPVQPIEWFKAIDFYGELPEVLKNKI